MSMYGSLWTCSGGLPITGLDGNTDCTSSTGQVYGRAAAYGNYYAIMYAW